ncbi:MAG: T9SS type A sorting domain-containing protein, partial [Bacteroidota bacterium]
EFDNITDFDRIGIIFAPGTGNTGTFFFDNLIQGESTVDLCAGIEPILTILDDFECQRNATYTVGAGDLSVVNNPDVSNANPSLSVGEFIDPPGAFNALVIDNGAAFDLMDNNQVSAKVWAPVAGQVLFKFEGGDNAPIEIFVDIPATEEWVNYEVDFSSAAGMGFTRLVLFFGAGTDNAENNTYYIDDIELKRAPFVSACVSDFESMELTLDNWRYFANGAFDDNAFIISANPQIGDGNMSAMVGTFEEATDGQPFAGMFADTPAPIELTSENRTVTMKVLMPVAGIVTFKLEGGIDGSPNSGDNNADYTTPGEWQELTWEFNTTQGGDPIPDGSRYGRVTIIPNFGVVPEEPLTHYFDDIAVGGGSCITVGLFNPTQVADLRVFPNPANDLLTVENNEEAVTFRITNLLGQNQQVLRTSIVQERVNLELNQLRSGMYVLTAYDDAGRLVAKSTFVKQ